MSEPTQTASYDSKSEAGQTLESFVRLWCDQINRSSDEEKDWRETQAVEAEKAYKGDRDSGVDDFNIFHANVETLVPALYNSTPVPDIRRRFLDNDPVGKEVAQILERCLSFSVDTYDFDGLMTTCTKDMAIVDRGIARVRYRPYFKGKVNDPETGDEIDKLAYQEVSCEYVPWRDYRRGPGRTREEMPWEAFKLYLDKEEIKRLIDGSKIKIEEIPFNYTASGNGDEPRKTDNPKEDVFKRSLVWEIWNKEKREVIFICPEYAKGPLKREQDPLELEQFFSTPKPMQAITATGDMTPITQFSIYKKLVDELNEITRRIRVLVKACRARGGYASSTPDIKSITEADEAELVALQGVEAFAQAGGLEKAIVWWPIEQISKGLETLYAQREIIKQTIYEVTGIADILRGATDARETLGAQQIKAQWGSLRIQRMQGEVARFARDLFRLKAELIANKFQPEVLQLMTGIEITPPVLELLRNDVVRAYRIDIESDSTIRADMIRNQETMTNFLQGTAQYLSAVGPAVQEGYMPADAAVAVYTAFARQFKLGKQAEDALDKLQEGAAQAAQAPKPPSPEELKLQAEQMKMGFEREKLELEKQKAQIDIEIKQIELQLKQAEMQADIQMQQQELQMKMQLEQQKAELEAQIKMKESEIKQQTMLEEHALKAKIKQDEAVLGMQMQQQKGEVEIEGKRAESAIGLQQKDAEFKQKLSHNEKANAQDLKLRERESEARAKQDKIRGDEKAKRDSEREDKERKEKPKAKKRRVKDPEGKVYEIEDVA